MALGRIKIVRNKRSVAMKQHRREIADLLKQGKQDYARIRVESVLRETATLQARRGAAAPRARGIKGARGVCELAAGVPAGRGRSETRRLPIPRPPMMPGHGAAGAVP
jgi:hypothetical protein